MEDEPIKETVDHPEHVNPAPEHVNPPVEPEKAHDEIGPLKDRVSSLETLVASIVDGKGPDTSPVKKPWTHYGSK